jgi:hypothetical protein
MTAQTGGRSLSYVPRPRRLLARRRGGSCGSPCHSLFFPRVLEHFVGFDFQIAQGRLRLDPFGIGLQVMSDFGGGRPTDTQFSRYLGRRFSLTHCPDKQDCLLRSKVAPFKHRPAVQIVDPPAFLTPVHIQFTALRSPKPGRLVKSRPTMGALHPFGVKIAFYPVEAGLAIH